MYVSNFPEMQPYLRVPKFTYSIVGFHGTGGITYREALAAVFMEGYVDTVTITEDYVLKRLGQMDFLRIIFARSSSMACPRHATVTRSLSRSWNWPLHCVSGALFVRTFCLLTRLQFHRTL